MSALSSDERVIVTLVDLEGWKISEVAELIKKSIGSIKMRLRRARDKMRKKLIEFYQLDNESTTKQESFKYALSRGSEETE
jgi:DNA-directed RNA polymerase specialized sigma24 family protein